MPDELVAFAKRPSVIQHRVEFDRAWGRFAQERLKPVSAFSARELDLPQALGPVYYPFSGPDILYALALFPQAKEYALTGLEPVGDVPDLARLDEVQVASSLAQLRQSLNAVLALSFFRTNDMKAELAQNRLSGVTPILLIFLARQQAEIAAVEPFILEKDGNLRLTTPASLHNLASSRIPGVRVTFTIPTDPQERTLYYFAADLSNKGLSNTPQYLPWIEGYAPRATLVKSASYLMHKSYFSAVRSLILDRSNLVMQDDSGIPFRLFSELVWDRRLLGAYAGPIPLFANWFQKDMKEAYDKAAVPIEFGIGYQHMNKRSNLQVFVKRASRTSS
ncbi:MAG: hypothetical protein ACKVQU_38375 [Burkholderiales bacterium]